MSHLLTNRIEVVFSFDTTGSMYPCLTQVRRNVRETVARLAREIPGIRIGIIAHGDYCDAGSTYVIKALDLTDDVEAISRFVDKVGPTGGGDAAECYEKVLHDAQALSWTPGYKRVLVLIGDDLPHSATEYQNKERLDWRTETRKLADMGVAVYAVQALGRYYATSFYQELGRLSGGLHLKLDQFSYITEAVLAICYKQGGDEMLQKYEREVIETNRMNRNLDGLFAALINGTEMPDDTPTRSTASTSRPRTTAPRKSLYDALPKDLRAVHPGRFQVLEVDRDCGIQDFVRENGAVFKKGRGFYEFMKTETIQGYKEVVLMDRKTGDLFSGEVARDMIGAPKGTTARLKPTVLEKYRVFIQSTSPNRKLIGGYGFLYELDDWDRAAA